MADIRHPTRLVWPRSTRPRHAPDINSVTTAILPSLTCVTRSNRTTLCSASPRIATSSLFPATCRSPRWTYHQNHGHGQSCDHTRSLKWKYLSTLNSSISPPSFLVSASKYVPGWVKPRSNRHTCNSSGFSYRWITSSCSHCPIFPKLGFCRCLTSVE